MEKSNKSPRIALITGGSRGLGRHMVKWLARQGGTDFIITYRSSREQAEEVVEHVKARGQHAVALQLDVAQAGGYAEFCAQVQSILRATWDREQFDCLINNAGEGSYASFAQTTEEQFDLMLNVHLKAPFFLTQGLLPMIQDGGRVLNVSSGLTRFTLPGFAAYSTMKGGLEVLTRYMAKELAARNISVNTLAPGAIETDFGGGQVRENKEMNKHIASTIALGRVGLPDDIGQAVAAILNPGTYWMTGQRIEVSGGQML